MMVFTKHGLKERINLCLFFQSLADFVFMTFNIILYADTLYLHFLDGSSSRRGAVSRFLINTHLIGFYGVVFASDFMTMVIACERCFCVVSPLRSQNILKTKSTLVVILVAFFFVIGGFFVVAMRWSVTCIFDPRTNSSSLQVYPGTFYLHNVKLVDMLDGVVYGVVLPGASIVIITVATVVTVNKLKQMASWREKASSAAVSVRDVALTRMLIGCSVLFIVCSVPAVMFRVLILIVPDLGIGGRYRNSFTFLISVTQMCNYINCSFNFFIYYAIGTKYRATLKAMCCSGTKGKPQTGRT